MKAKNLMVGNYVKDPYNHTIKLVSVEKDQSMVRPIPITEEWLNYLGFEKTERRDAHVINVGEYDLYVAVNAFSGTLEKDPSWHCSVATGYGSQPMSIMKIYIHELQNLFFALTGTQLEVKQSVSV